MTKKLEVFIREEALDAVKEALQKIGIVGMNVFEVRGHGRQGGIELSWRGTTYRMDLLPKMQVNIILSDHNVEKAVETIVQTARTGKEGRRIDIHLPRRGYHPHPHGRAWQGSFDVRRRHRHPPRRKISGVGAAAKSSTKIPPKRQTRRRGTESLRLAAGFA